MENLKVIECLATYKSAVGHEKRLLKIHLERDAASSIVLQSLRVTVTCPSDACLLYCLTVSESGFAQLRSSQALLVDFAQFPQRLAELVQLCADQASQPAPRFSLVLDASSSSNCGGVGGGSEGLAELDVVEANAFKHLSHISLRLAPASQQRLTQHLADTITTLKGELEAERRRSTAASESSSSQLTQLEQQLAERGQQLSQVQQQLRQLNNEADSSRDTKLALERASARQERKELERRHSEQVTELRDQQRRRVNDLEQRVNALDKQCRQLTELKYKQEMRVREMEGRSSSLDSERQHLKQECSSLRSHNHKLEEQMRNKFTSDQELKTRLAVLQTELKDARNLQQRQEQFQQAATSSKRQMEDRVSELQCSLARREKSLQAVSHDLLKANDIIRKLQNESKTHHAKLKMHAQIAVEQEKLVAETAASRDQLQSQLTAAAVEREQWQLLRAELQKQLSDSQLQAATAEKHLKTSEQVVAWLNKQLTDMRVSGGVDCDITGAPAANCGAAAVGSTRHRKLLTHASSTPAYDVTSSPTLLSTPLASSTRTAVAGGAATVITPPVPATTTTTILTHKGDHTAAVTNTSNNTASGTVVAAARRPDGAVVAAAVEASAGKPARTSGGRPLAAHYLHAARGGAPSMAGLVRRPLTVHRS